MITDNPELDGTDGAHPAYWRGHDQAVVGLCQKINEILDGKLLQGVCAEPWEATRQRLAALAAANGVLRRLEKFIARGMDTYIADIRHSGNGRGGFGVTLKHGYPSRSAAAFSTVALTDAINAALDAAG